MTTRLAPFALALALPLALGLASPARAQAPAFGDDASQWSNDGECDDPRFEGAGMTTTPLLEADASHDATDCSAAFEAGTITLAGGGSAPVKGGRAPAVADTEEASPVAPRAPRTPRAPRAPRTPRAAAAGTETDTGGDIGAPDFGDDAGEYPSDGECDDRRFVGQGMAQVLAWTNAGHDASDCQALAEAGSIRIFDLTAAAGATQCGSVDFGDDSGEFASDGECDDMRFEGLGMASSVGAELIGRDATDCSRYCATGMIGLRGE